MGSEGGEALTVEPLPLRLRPPGEPWRRISARLVDAATVLTVLWVLVVLRVLWFVPGLTDRFEPEPWGRSFVVTVTFVVFAAVYEAVFVSRSSGQTPGMDIMNVRVLGPGEDGRVGAVRALARALPLLAVPAIRPIWAAIAVLAIFALMRAGPGRRSIVDALAGTTVVPYDRDREDPTARRPLGRHHRRAMEHDTVPLGAVARTATPDRPGREQ